MPTRSPLRQGFDEEPAPGRLFLADSARPVTPTAEGCAVAVLAMPRRHLLCSDESLARACDRTYDVTRGTASLLYPLLLTLAEAPANFAECTATRLRNQLVDLVAALVTEAVEPMPPENDQSLVHGIRRWVNDRLTDPDLRPGTIAAANYVSVRRLHKLFTGERGTISSWIQERRLEECRRELGRGDGGPVKVSAVAQRWGFANAAHFSRAFRARYGISPKDWRALRATKDGTADV
ncbi:helix-turn-helix domain-containing protein [Streptomyces sp. YS415]|uniref:helix-turn-helix domain-containing protein n=1 Tax=Streptomyces sp. YS415 TaxID=2944806 RepID=UPI0024C46F68|nr:helix-turn-helix domain-containing protein [Streptomyces sp. YS415]